MKRKLRAFLGISFYNKIKRPLKYLRDYKDLYINFIQDRKLYKKHSNVFHIDNFKKKEAQLILYYHSLEKGFLFDPIRPRFAKEKVKLLHKYLRDQEVINNIAFSQVRATYAVICRYYELHQTLQITIEDYYPKRLYELYRKTLKDDYSENFKGTISVDKKVFYANVNSDFSRFSSSRKSIRDFTGELVPEERIVSAIKLASNSPSVCNRQSVKVYLLQNKEKIDRLLTIQAGFRGFSENVNQLLIVSSNRNYFYTVGEKNQLYIDGGVFLMNLLYSLHHHQIANCPANWGKTIEEDRRANDILDLGESEKIICLIPIGESKDNVKFCLSTRRDVREIYQKLV